MKQTSIKKARTILFMLGVTAVLAVGLAVAARYDLALDQALHPLWVEGLVRHANGQFSLWYSWALWAEVLGALPAYAAAPLLGWCICALAKREKRLPWPRLVAGIGLVCVGCGAMAWVVMGYLNKRQPGQTYNWWLPGVLLALIPVLLLSAWYNSASLVRLRRWHTLAVLWAAMSLAQLALVQLLKAVWQRTRFDDMVAAGDFSHFTGWLQPGGYGGSSFPSGHTASAGVLLVLVFACRLFESCRDDEPGFLFVGYGFAAAVAFGRLLIGRHYLSDTLVALAVDSLLLALLWFAPPVKRLIRRIVQPPVVNIFAAPAAITPERPVFAVGNARKVAQHPASQPQAGEKPQPAEPMEVTTEVNRNAETEAKAEAETETGVAIDADAEAETATKTETKIEAPVESNAEIEAETETAIKAETEAEINTGLETETNINVGPDPKPAPDPKPGPAPADTQTEKGLVP